MTKKVFVSLPMRDRLIDEIREDMNDILDIIKPIYAELDEDVELIDTVWMDSPGPDILDEGSWYLGRSIQALSRADLAIFHPGWREARGCIIEHMVCAMYNIPYFDISMKYGDDYDFVDHTHDWNEAGEINSVLSEEVAKAEGLDDILHEDDDVEDALGIDREDVDILEPGEYDADLNPYAQHTNIDISIMDEFDENGKLVNSDILKRGEDDADIR